jgi:hypothetical protein
MLTMLEIEWSDMSVSSRLSEAASHVNEILEENEWLDISLSVEIQGIRITVMHNSRMFDLDRIVSWTDIEQERFSPLEPAIDEAVSQMLGWRTT